MELDDIADTLFAETVDLDESTNILRNNGLGSENIIDFHAADGVNPAPSIYMNALRLTASVLRTHSFCAHKDNYRSR